MSRPKKPSQPEPGDPAVRCTFTRMVDPRELRPNPENPNRHSQEQIRIYAKIIRHQGWRKAVVVSKLSGLVVTGHGAVATAIQNGWKLVPVDDQDFASQADEMQHCLADNQLSELSTISEEDLAKALGNLGEDDRQFTAFKAGDIDRILGLQFQGEARELGSDITDKVPREKEVCIVPIALTREQAAKWEEMKAKNSGKSDKAIFLKMIGL